MMSCLPRGIKLGENELLCFLFDVSLFNGSDMASSLNREEIARARRLHSGAKRHQFIVTRALLRYLLSRLLVDISPGSVFIHYSPHGKPGVDYRFRNAPVRFNVSHAGQYALLGFTLAHEIGVDIEMTQRSTDCLALAKRYFSRREYRALLAFDKQEQHEAFYRGWTRKEAFIKAEGTGIGYGLDKFSVSLADLSRPARVAVDMERHAVGRDWYHYPLPRIEGYQSALAADTDGMRVKQHIVTD